MQCIAYRSAFVNVRMLDEDVRKLGTTLNAIKKSLSTLTK